MDSYALEDAERAIVLPGASAGVRDVVDELRAEGERVGVLTIRSFRPFPRDAGRTALAGVDRVEVLDRAAPPAGRRRSTQTLPRPVRVPWLHVAFENTAAVAGRCRRRRT